MPTYSFEESINQYLRATAGVASLVTTGTTKRIYIDQAPAEAALPYIVFAVEGETVEETFATPSNALRRASVAIQCWADRTSSGTLTARTIAEAVVTALTNYKGTLVTGGKTVAAVNIESIDGELADDAGYDDQRIGRTVRCAVWYYG